MEREGAHASGWVVWGREKTRSVGVLRVQTAARGNASRATPPLRRDAHLQIILRSEETLNVHGGNEAGTYYSHLYNVADSHRPGIGDFGSGRPKPNTHLQPEGTHTDITKPTG